MSERDDEDDRPNPLILDLSAFAPQTEAGRKGLRDAIRGKKNRGRTGTHPWDEDEDEPRETPIPMLPKKEVEIVAGRERAGISDRDRAAANLKVDLFSYQEIAEILEFPSAQHAKRAVERVLALTHSVDDYDTIRMMAQARAEKRLRLSSQMADAAYLVVKGEDGEEKMVPNEKQLGWAAQASTDFMNWATITGAKAATKIEISPDVDAMEALVSRIATAAGHGDLVEADVLELEVIPDLPNDEEDPDAEA